MKEETKRFIEKLTNTIKLEYNITSPIKDIDSIVESLGGKVKTEKFDRTFEGSIKRVGLDNFEIRVSPEDSEFSRNVFIAKDLGHLFLHMGFRTDNELWEKQSLSEYRFFDNCDAFLQADLFANNFLIPKEELLESFKKIFHTEKISYDSLDRISKYFNVPKSRVLSYSLKEGVLNYFQER